jgi:hypothetical protein
MKTTFELFEEALISANIMVLIYTEIEIASRPETVRQVVSAQSQ